MNSRGFAKPAVLFLSFSIDVCQGWYKRGELNIWTKTKAFNIFKQFTGMDDLWGSSEIFIMCPLNFMKCGQAHKPGDTSWHKTSDWRLIKEKKKKRRIIFVWTRYKQRRPPGRWVEFCSSHSAFQPWTGVFVFYQSRAFSISRKSGKGSVA